MKRLLLSAASLLMLAPLATMAQNDDVYFVPTKKQKTQKQEEKVKEHTTVYSVGTERDVDEYNRRQYRSSYVRIDNDSTGDDIIDFEGEPLPDTLYLYEDEPSFGDSEYYYSRLMSRFDDYYGWYPYFYHSPYYWDYPYWGGPYTRYAYHWGAPWLDYWYNSWDGLYRYSWYPYTYYGGWYRPAVAWSGHTGTRNHGHVTQRPKHDGVGTDRYFGSRTASTSRTVTTGTFGSNSVKRDRTTRNTRVSNGVFGGSRANRSNDTRYDSSSTSQETFGTRHNNTSTQRHSGFDSSTRQGSFGNGSSYGGVRSSGGSFGGGHSVGGGVRSGGGHFGGGRR